jgi:hypothetical protein
MCEATPSSLKVFANYVRSQLGGETGGLLTISSLANHLQVAFAPNRLAVTFPHYDMVLGEQNPNLARRPLLRGLSH